MRRHQLELGSASGSAPETSDLGPVSSTGLGSFICERRFNLYYACVLPVNARAVHGPSLSEDSRGECVCLCQKHPLYCWSHSRYGHDSHSYCSCLCLNGFRQEGHS